MSGHSKWHTIKHKKGAADAKRGKVFTRIIKELSVAARNGGGDPDSNPRLRTIIADAKSVNMPADNIKRAIQRGTGELPGVNYDEITYEAYGPGGVAIMIEVLTDNKNRTVGEVRHTLGKHGGNLGEANSVAWMFEKKGYIVVDKAGADEEKLLAAAIDAGADELRGPYVRFPDPAPLVDDLLAEAVHTARRSAERMAAAAGRALGRVLSVSDGRIESDWEFSSEAQAMSRRSGGDSLDSEPPPVIPRPQRLFIAVTVVFALVD